MELLLLRKCQLIFKLKTYIWLRLPGFWYAAARNQYAADRLLVRGCQEAGARLPGSCCAATWKQVGGCPEARVWLPGRCCAAAKPWNLLQWLIKIIYKVH